MTIVVTPTRRSASHTFCVPVVRELPVPRPAAGVVISGAW
jgi:hypothetical protein